MELDNNAHSVFYCIIILSLWLTVCDNGWGMFTGFLQYKLEEEGKRLVNVDKFYASSQLCHVCGYKNTETKDLSVREWDCPVCKTHHNRDINVAKNYPVDDFLLGGGSRSLEGVGDENCKRIYVNFRVQLFGRNNE